MYPLIYGLFYLISLLPFPVLYKLSDVCYIILYKLVGYRKMVVLDNLKASFPEASHPELEHIASQYYRNLCDMIVETVKLLTISPKTLRKRFTCDASFLHAMFDQQQTCQIHLGHQFNWEWANLYFQLEIKQPFLVVYMPLTNKAMDRLFKKIRGRFGGIMIPANTIAQSLQPWKGKVYVSVLVADQNPGNPRRALWVPFLNRMTAFYKGPEMTARRNHAPVVFGEIQKTNRGYYKASMTPITMHPEHLPEGNLTSEFCRRLETQIKLYPSNWVWSHRRWKHVYSPKLNDASDTPAHA